MAVKKELEKNIEESVVANNASTPSSFSNSTPQLEQNSNKTEQESVIGQQIAMEIAMEEARETKYEQEKTIEESKQQVETQKSKKKKLTSLIMMLINIVVVVIIMVVQLSGDDAVPLGTLLESGINLGYLVLLLLAFGVMVMGEGIKLSVLMKKSTGKFNFSIGYKTGALGRYYDSITPLSTGGQPFQIYYLSSHGFSAGQSISVSLGKYCFWQISYFLITTTVMIMSLTPLINVVSNGGAAVVSVASWVGYVLSSSLMFIIILISINRKVGTKIVGWFVKLGHKCKLIKNYDKTYGKVMKVVDDFQGSMKYYAKSPKTFISSLGLGLGSLLLNYTIPYLIYCTIVGPDPSMWFYTFMMCVIIDLAASFIPLPGGTGMSELSFTALFAFLFKDGTLFWAMLLWRICTYYGYILQGLIVIMYDYFIGNKKYNWSKRKDQLEQESEGFKSKQIEVYNRRKQKKSNK